jgi:hypothetical protein
MDGSHLAEAAEAAQSGGPRQCHGRQRWLTGPRLGAHYDSPNSTWFAPTGSQRDGDSVWLTLKRRRAMWRAGGDDFLRNSLANGVGLIQRHQDHWQLALDIL